MTTTPRSGDAESSGDDGDDMDPIDVLIVAAIPLEHEAARPCLQRILTVDDERRDPAL